MKYGYILTSNAEQLHTPPGNSDASPQIEGRTVANLGDHIQSLGIIELYRYMGIPEKDIIPIDRNEIATYDGEPVILPLNYYFIIHLINSFPPSPNIIPVFWGYAADNMWYHQYNYGIDMFRDYFRLFQPIGCRDDATCENLRTHGVNAYVTGCASFFFPRRQIDGGKKVFLIDVPATCLEIIPQTIRSNAVYFSHEHEIPLMTRTIMHQEAHKTLNLARQRLSIYAMEARLVVTTRLHVAAPCIAMGIPVVLVDCWNCKEEEKNIAHRWRYSWLNKIIQPLTLKDLATLDWDSPPSPLVDVEAYKKEMIDQAKKVVEEAVYLYDSGEFAALRPQILENTLVLFRAYVETHYMHSEYNLESVRAMYRIHKTALQERDEAKERSDEFERQLAKHNELEGRKTESYNEMSEYEKTQKLLDSFLNSKSWRITAPLRWIWSLFRKNH